MHKTFKMVILTMSISALAAGPAFASSHTAGQMARAGYTCFPAGPTDWIHCMLINKLDDSAPVVPVKVFSVDGMDFLGTELLLHEDTYSGQPCPTDDLNLWEDTGFGYFACHHFLTEHH